MTVTVGTLKYVLFPTPIVLILVKAGFLGEGCYMGCASVLAWQDERR